jgi:hypothetical protein
VIENHRFHPVSCVLKFLRIQTRLRHFFDVAKYAEFFNAHPLEWSDTTTPSDASSPAQRVTRGEVIEAIREHGTGKYASNCFGNPESASFGSDVQE